MRVSNSLLAVTLVCLAGMTVKADVIAIEGTSDGRFEFVRIPSGKVLGPLSYAQGPAFAGATNAAGTYELTHLGAFTLGQVDEFTVLLADLFDFRVFINFVLPVGIQGPSPAFLAELQGQARFLPLFPDNPESVELEFAANSVNIAYVNPAGSGSFTLMVDDMTVANGRAIFEKGEPVALTGRITNAVFTPVPETGSGVLAGIGAAILLVFRRRRRR